LDYSRQGHEIGSRISGLQLNYLGILYKLKDSHH